MRTARGSRFLRTANGWPSSTEGCCRRPRTTGSSRIPLVERREYAAEAPDWGPEGEIAFVDVVSQRLCVVGENGGDVRCFGEDPLRPREPHFLPDGSGILFSDVLEGLSLLDLASGRITVLAEDGIDGTYIDTGHILYGRSTRGLFAIPFDLKRHRVTGPPVPLVPDVAATNNNSYYSVSRTGTLLFWDGSGTELPTVLTMLRPDGSGDTIPGRGRAPATGAVLPGREPDRVQFRRRRP